MTGTIGDLIDGHYHLWLHCEVVFPDGQPCNWSHDLDLVQLAATLGRDHPATASDLNGRFRCKRCGQRKTIIMVHPPTVRDIETGELR